MNESPKFRLNKEEVKKILHAFAYSVAATTIAAVLAVIASLDIPPQYLYLVPIINAPLYALLKFFQGKAE